MKSMMLIFALLIATIEVSAATSILSGKIVDEQGQPLANASITIGTAHVNTDIDGRYAIELAQADVYALRISSDGFYGSIQTHSHFELSQASSLDLVINDIELVRKKKGRTLLAFGGDVMMGRRYSKPYFGNEVLINKGHEQEDTKALVKYVKPYMSLADLAAVNLETQIATTAPSERAPKSVTFFSPPETLGALAWAGIDYVTLGNNHTYDYLDSGLKSSLEYLKHSKLGYSGAGINQREALAPYQVALNGNDFSMLGYVGWEGNFSPNQTAGPDKGGAAHGTVDNIKQSVTKEANQGRVTVVQYHGSQEYEPEPTLVTEQRLKTAIDSGAALAIAHHPHVSQGFEIYNGKLIAYSMGNFIFDQYFYATPHSFILYVWMDGEDFHRAEIVPIYLKGYQPTPSTGVNRYTVLRRLTELSRKRGVNITVSGGHGVISPTRAQQANASSIKISSPVAQQVLPLPLKKWQQRLTGVQTNDSSLRYRLGVNLLNGSDFESFDLFGSAERGWNIDQNGFSLSQERAASGKKSLKASVSPQAAETLAMSNFRRVYRGGNPMTITFKVNVSQDTKLKVYWHGRKKKEKFFGALNNGKETLIKTIALNGQAGWQSIEVPFNSPRIGYKSIRVLAKFDNESAQASEVFVDDFALVEWQSAFTNSGQRAVNNGLTQQASFIEFSRKLTPQDEINLHYGD